MLGLGPLGTGVLGSLAASYSMDMASQNKLLWGRSSCQTSGDAGIFLAEGGRMECKGIIFSGSDGNSALKGFGGRWTGVSGWKSLGILLSSSPCSQYLPFTPVLLLGRSRER